MSEQRSDELEAVKRDRARLIAELHGAHRERDSLLAELAAMTRYADAQVGASMRAATELRSLRGVVQAATDLVRSAQGSHFFHGWDPGIVSVRDLAAALGIEPDGPPPPPTEAELQEMRDMLAEVRSDRALAAAADAPQPDDTGAGK